MTDVLALGARVLKHTVVNYLDLLTGVIGAVADSIAEWDV